MRSYIGMVGLWVAVLAGWISCDQGTRTDTAAVAERTNQVGTTNYHGRGVVTEVRAVEKKVVIKHEAIPGYMPAMTMPFEVRETNWLAELKPGDTVDFRLRVTAEDAWIDQVRKFRPTNSTPAVPNSLPTNGSFRLVREVEPLEVGDPMPDYTFTNQIGRAVRLSEFRGQVLAFTFIYTRCPLPMYCPRLSSNFAEVSKKLADGPDRWHLLSISFDPKNDTPATLLQYAGRYSYDPKHWDFVTGALIDIDAITEQFGLFFSRQEGTPNWDHNMRTVVVNPSGKVRRIFVGNSWTADELAEEIRQAMR